MKISSIVLVVVTSVALAGCAITAVPEPTGGSRSDGVVELSYEYGSMQQVTVDESAAQSSARERCESWGYEDAEAFGGGTRECVAPGGYGCNRWQVTTSYQCTNGD